jgi:hypothetical protein
MLNHLYVPLLEPEDIKRHLAKESHWKVGFSAQQLALAWSNSNGQFPPRVKSLLKTSSDFASVELIDGFFEREVNLGTPGRNSQTDLMVIVGIGDTIAVLAVEGKVDETLGQLVSEWSDGSAGKAVRLRGLCSTLGLDINSVGNLRYQLLHRTASAIYEAKRYRCRKAVMLVHSFSATKAWLPDFERFTVTMGIGVNGHDVLSSIKSCEGVDIQLGWVSDKLQV